MEEPPRPPRDLGHFTEGADHVMSRKLKSTMIDTESANAHKIASLQQLALHALPEGTPLDLDVYNSAANSEIGITSLSI